MAFLFLSSSLQLSQYFIVPYHSHFFFISLTSLTHLTDDILVSIFYYNTLFFYSNIPTDFLLLCHQNSKCCSLSVTLVYQSVATIVPSFFLLSNPIVIHFQLVCGFNRHVHFFVSCDIMFLLYLCLYYCIISK